MKDEPLDSNWEGREELMRRDVNPAGFCVVYWQLLEIL